MQKLRRLSICLFKIALKIAQWGIFCPVLAAGGKIDQDNITFQSSGWCRQIDDGSKSWLSPCTTPPSGIVDRHRSPRLPYNVHGVRTR